MDKQQEAQADSLSTVTVKEYPPSEGFGSEPPPAYQKLRSNSVQIARLAAITIVASSFVLGSFILAAAWIQANASCHQDLYDMPEHLLQPQALTQDVADLSDEPSNHVDEPLAAEDGADQQQQQEQLPHRKDEDQQQPSASPEPSAEQPGDEEHVPVRVRLPLQLDFDDIAGMLVQKNQRSRMNCVVEKKRAEEIVDHQPRTLKLPFGVNVTTDPRYEHVSGEKMAISCESGSDQRHAPMDAMMHGAGPVVIPLPGPVHLPLQFHGALQQRLRAQQLLQQHQQQMELRAAQQGRAHHMQASPPTFHLQQLPFPMVVPVPLQTTVHVAEQPEQPEEAREHQVQFPVHPQQQQQQQQQQEVPRHMLPPPQHHVMPEGRQSRMFPQVVDVTELREGAPFPPPQEMEVVELREARAFQPPQQLQPEGPRAFQRLPVHMPVHMPMPMMHQQPPPQQPHQSVHADEPRPHYVQPRSVRSVDDVLHRREKRMRRCACDCAC